MNIQSVLYTQIKNKNEMKIQARAWKQFISSNSRLLSFPHRIRFAVQIILSVLLAAVIVSHSRQSRSLRGFFWQA